MNYLIISTDDPPFVCCADCDGGANAYRGHGEYCGTCDGHGERPLDMSALATLAHNLAIGAALCRSYELGANPPDLGPGQRIPLKTGVAWIPDGVWQPGHALSHASLQDGEGM